MVTVLKYLITYLDECELVKVEQVEAANEADALSTLEKIAIALEVVPVGVRGGGH